MSDYAMRPMTREDAAAVNDLLAAAEAVDRTEEHYNLDDVLEELGDPLIDPAKDWLVVEHQGQVVAHCRLMPRAPAGGAVSVALDGTVHPEHRRRGVGSMLVPVMVDRARAYVEERGPGLRAVITGHAPSDNQDLERLFAREGLVPRRWSFLMAAELDAPDAANADGESEPVLPEGYTLHTWEDVDHDEVRDAHNRAFVGHYGFTPWSGEMWEQWVAGSRAFRPAVSLLARDEAGRVAAYVQSSEYDAVTEATGVREAYVAKVGTLEEHRGRGLAGRMLRVALARYRAAGFQRATLDVDSENPTGALGIYEKAGFRVQQRWTNYRLG